MLDVLHEEIVKNVCGTKEKDKGVEPTWLMSVANVSTVGVKAAKVGAGDGPTSSPHVSHSPGWHSQTRSPSPHCHSQSSRSSSSSSGSSSRSGVHLVPTAQVHLNWALAVSLTLALQLALALDPKLDLKHLQTAVVLVSQNALAPHHLM